MSRAFSGAIGFGAYARGGAGGGLHVVTNLKDSGQGSLRWALSHEPPFCVSVEDGLKGTIKLERVLVVNRPFVTMELQGLQLRNFGLQIVSGAHDVVVRGLTSRPGPSQPNENALSIYCEPGRECIHDIIIDQCSLGQSTDENVNVWGDCRRITIQRCMIHEGLVQGNPKGPHSMGLMCGGVGQQEYDDYLTIARNVFCNNATRNPRLACLGRVDVCQNVIANWESYALDVMPHEETGRRCKANVHGNTFLQGPGCTHPSRLPIQLHPLARKVVHVERNYSRELRHPGSNNWNIVGRDLFDCWPVEYEYRQIVPWPTPVQYAVQPFWALECFHEVLSEAGSGDEHDDELRQQVVSGAGRVGG